MVRALTVNTTAYHSATRSPKELRLENIADAPHRVKKGLLERTIELLTQPAHQHVHHIGLGIELITPDMRQDHRLGDHAAGIAHEVFEKRELARAELDLLSASG